MAKITIQLEGKANYSVNINDSKAIEAYTKIIDLLNSTMFEKKEDIIPEIIPEDHAPLDHSLSNPFRGRDFFKYKKLVAYKCHECGKITVRFLTLGEDNITHCHFCRHEGIDIRYVRRAIYKCDECGFNAYVYVANGLQEVSCKNCEAVIGLSIDSEDDILKSENLLGEKGA